MELCELASGRTCAQDSRINHQRAYGADVISRIQASVDGNGKLLKMSICRDLLSGILELTKQAEISAGQIKRMVISANTTMCHLLMGYPCDSLGASPFTPVNIQTIYTDVYSVMERCWTEPFLHRIWQSRRNLSYCLEYQPLWGGYCCRTSCMRFRQKRGYMYAY